eukprot:1435460-Amphidinium_carterae.1
MSFTAGSSIWSEPSVQTVLSLSRTNIKYPEDKTFTPNVEEGRLLVGKEQVKTDKDIELECI